MLQICNAHYHPVHTNLSINNQNGIYIKIQPKHLNHDCLRMGIQKCKNGNSYKYKKDERNETKMQEKWKVEESREMKT